MSDEPIATGSGSFTDRKPFVVTEDDVQREWGLQKPGSGTTFRCAWCGRKFKPGDTARWVYTNTDEAHKAIRGNPFICGNCDGPNHIERLVEMAQRVAKTKTECWWFFR